MSKNRERLGVVHLVLLPCLSVPTRKGDLAITVQKEVKGRVKRVRENNKESRREKNMTIVLSKEVI